MAHAEGSVEIDRPPAQVYAFVLDGANNPLWRPAVLEIERVAGAPSGLGATYRQRLKGPGGRPIDGDYKIVAATPDTRISFQVTAGPARPTGTYTFEAAGDATRVTLALRYETKGVAKLMDPLITATMRSEVATLANLKAYLENRPR